VATPPELILPAHPYYSDPLRSEFLSGRPGNPFGTPGGVGGSGAPTDVEPPPVPQVVVQGWGLF